MNEEVIEKIKKLLTRTEASGATQAEAEVALQMAQRLALKHEIDLAAVDVTDSGGKSHEREPFVQQPFRPERAGGGPCVAKLPASHRYIVGLLVKFFSVKIIEVESREYYIDKGVKKFGVVKSLSVIGRQSQVQIALYVYGYLYDEFARRWHAYKEETGARLEARGSFYSGLYRGLYAKLEAEQEAFVSEEQVQLDKAKDPLKLAGETLATSVSLILVKEEEKLKQATEGYHPRLVYVKRSAPAVKDWEAAERGSDEGREIEIKTALK